MTIEITSIEQAEVLLDSIDPETSEAAMAYLDAVENGELEPDGLAVDLASQQQGTAAPSGTYANKQTAAEQLQNEGMNTANSGGVNDEAASATNSNVLDILQQAMGEQVDVNRTLEQQLNDTKLQLEKTIARMQEHGISADVADDFKLTDERREELKDHGLLGEHILYLAERLEQAQSAQQQAPAAKAPSPQLDDPQTQEEFTDFVGKNFPVLSRLISKDQGIAEAADSLLKAQMLNPETANLPMSKRLALVQTQLISGTGSNRQSTPKPPSSLNSLGSAAAQSVEQDLTSRLIDMTDSEFNTFAASNADAALNNLL